MKQPNNQPNIIELQIILLAFGTLGVLDNVSLGNIKSIIYLGASIITCIFGNTEFKILTKYLRHLDARQIKSIVIYLLKYVFLKTNRINSN